MPQDAPASLGSNLGPADPVLAVQGLRAYYRLPAAGDAPREVRAVDDISLRIGRDEIYGIAGESSSGKTSLIKTIARAIRPPMEVVGGTVTFDFGTGPRDLYAMPAGELAGIRWRHLSYIMQGSMNVLNPVRRISRSFEDFARPHIVGSKAAFRATVEQHLDHLRLQPSVLDSYPHELSGGMRQRVTIALATVCRPRFVIADEPTTVLDVIVQKSVLQMLRSVQKEMKSSVLFVTHDMAVHANLTDRLGIMYAGRLVEEARTRDLFRHPLHPYTAHLIGSLPRIGDDATKAGLAGQPPNLARPPSGCRFHPRCPLVMDVCRSVSPPLETLMPGHRVACHAAPSPGGRGMSVPASPELPLLELRNVGRTYAGNSLFSRRRVAAVQDVSFRLEAGRPEVFAIIGESGSGKSTLARMMLNSLTPTSGSILFQGRDLATIRRRHDRLAFMRRVQPIFQNPFEAFNPLRRIEAYLFATAQRFGTRQEQAGLAAAVDRALRQVGLSLDEVAGRFPQELSSGQLQRVAIARALIPGPALLVADEPVSMVDASLRMTIINLFHTLRDRLGVSIIYITHGFATAYYVSDRIVIMRNSRIVEQGDARSVLSAPRHPYSILLKDSVLSVEGAWADTATREG